ncbi:MAG: T9SS type A sorting domain-containing protein [Bacteroidetes bacterium]|nr:T9SS type A sorting domain-containing protein [Bacteroidota bacterium]
MRPRRIQLSGVFPAPLLLVVTLTGAFLRPQLAEAQCTGGTIQSVTYSTTLTGTGTATYGFTLPQFNPSPQGYTLLSAVVSSRATTTNTITFTNTLGSEQDFGPQISRSDNVRLGASVVKNGSAQYNDYDYTILDPTGMPNDEVTYGPGTIYDNTQIFSDSITNTSTLTTKYQGAGNLNLTYASTFFVNNVQQGINIVTDFHDNINFSVTYYFCNPTTLATGILDFTAERTDEETATLKWINTNEQTGRRYVVEVSANGQDFAPAGTVPSDMSGDEASYNYIYPIPPSATGKLYFRIKQVESDGKASWSDVRTISLDGNGLQVFTIYPNPPTDYINLTIPGVVQDWQIDIFTASGSLIHSNLYRSTQSPKIIFSRRLAAGSYFVRVTSPRSGKRYSGSFLVR